MALTITTDGELAVSDATGSAGVAYLSGVADGASVALAVTMSNGFTVPLAGAILNTPIVVTHGTGAALLAEIRGSGSLTNLTLDFYPL